MIQTSLRRNPVTSVLSAVLAAWMLWYGIVLLTFEITPARRVSFEGPAHVMGLRWWGVAFVIGAAVQVARLLLMKRRTLAVWLNAAPTAVCVCWAAGWLAGNYSTAQPTYCFVAVIAAVHPHLRTLYERYFNVTWIE